MHPAAAQLQVLILRSQGLSCAGMGLVWASEQLLLAVAPAASVTKAVQASLVEPACSTATAYFDFL